MAVCSHSRPTSNLSSMEYIETGVQTEAKAAPDPRPLWAPRDLVHLKRKGSADSHLEAEGRPPGGVNLGRSVSAGDKVKHCVPKVSKRWNQSLVDTSSDHACPRGALGPSPSESLPALSAPASFLHRDLGGAETPEEASESPRSRSSESVVASTIREESVASDTLDETATLAEEERRASSPVAVPDRQSFPSAESLPTSTPPEGSPGERGEAGEGEGEEKPEKVGKKHPSKFLKRAQSLSQVFKKMADKRKKYGEATRDDYQFAIRAPLGELALVPLEKLVSIEDLQKQMISEEP